MGVWGWPATATELEKLQLALARAADEAPSWRPEGAFRAAGTFFASTIRAGDAAWAAAVVVQEARTRSGAVVGGAAGAPYRPGLLALREGALLEKAVRALEDRPEVLLVNASGRDHARRAGLALHLGAVLDLPSVGVTDRPLVASGAEPGPGRGEAAPLDLGGELVGHVLRTRRGARPLVVHAAWRTDPGTAREVVLAMTARARTPEPIRRARHLARVARARDEGRLPAGWRNEPFLREPSR